MSNHPTPRFIPDAGVRASAGGETRPRARLAPARASDSHKLVALARAFCEDVGTEPCVRRLRALEELLESPDKGRAYLITAFGDIVGYALLCFGFSVGRGGRAAVLEEIYVDPRARGKGIGGEALTLLEREARALGARALHLEMPGAGARADALCRRAGFAERDGVILAKRLANA